MYEFDTDAAGRDIIPSVYIKDMPEGMSFNFFAMYRTFVFYRHMIWEARQKGFPAPWAPPAYTILNSKKFTNVYRVLDPGSQYVVDMLQEPGLAPEDALARAILYRFTNRPETWDHMKAELGRWPLAADMNGDLVKVIHTTPGSIIFSGAYIIMPTPGKEGDKVVGAVALARRLTARGGSERAVEQVVGATTPARAYEALRGHFGMGDFMSMQVLTDWGYYWPGYDENEFVVAGPGAKKGVAHLFPDGTKHNPEEVIRWVRDSWYEDLACPSLPLPEGGHRAPSLMDIQNTFCEFSKYVRYIKNDKVGGAPYSPAHPGAQPKPILPHHWSTGS